MPFGAEGVITDDSREGRQGLHPFPTALRRLDLADPATIEPATARRRPPRRVHASQVPLRVEYSVRFASGPVAHKGPPTPAPLDDAPLEVMDILQP